MAGTVALTGMLVRSSSGKPCQPASMAAAKPAGGLGVGILGERSKLAPSQRAAEEQGFALQDPAELHAHGQNHHAGALQQVLEGRVLKRHEFTVPGHFAPAATPPPLCGQRNCADPYVVGGAGGLWFRLLRELRRRHRFLLVVEGSGSLCVPDSEARDHRGPAAGCGRHLEGAAGLADGVLHNAQAEVPFR